MPDVKHGCTIWVCQASGKGTHHVSYHENTASLEDAKREAMEETIANWGGDTSMDDLTVLGVAYGNVTLLEWNDWEVFGD